MRVIEFRQGDLLKVDAAELAFADAVLMQVCLPTSLHPAVCRKTRELKPGAKLFAFADLAFIWPADLGGPPCHLAPCRGADDSASDKHYKTSWSFDGEGHPFFLMQAGLQEEALLGELEDCRDKKALERARTATNPSNRQHKDDEDNGEEEHCSITGQKIWDELGAGTSDECEALSPGRSVEVAPRQYLASRSADIVWQRAWVVKVHTELCAVDVLYKQAGDLEELCNVRRIRVSSESDLCIAVGQ
ncbi:unnamed protein product [Polarella glacialis]|nr:unnamed protein product [Polarella glacialis]